jgi:hypothetical protein
MAELAENYLLPVAYCLLPFPLSVVSCLSSVFSHRSLLIPQHFTHALADRCQLMAESCFLDTPPVFLYDS